jgi:hypothetical protein
MLGVMSAMFDSLGFVVQKLGHIQAAEQKKKYLKHPTWILGLICQILSVPFMLTALNLCSQTALSFVPALAIIFIIIWSRLILKVPMTRYDLLALAFVIPGIILILRFSAIKKVDIKSWRLGYYFFSPQTIIYVSIMVILFILFGSITYKMLVKFNMLTAKMSLTNPNSGEVENLDALTHKPDILETKNIYLSFIFLTFFAGFTATFSNT